MRGSAGVEVPGRKHEFDWASGPVVRRAFEVARSFTAKVWRRRRQLFVLSFVGGLAAMVGVIVGIVAEERGEVAPRRQAFEHWWNGANPNTPDAQPVEQTEVWTALLNLDRYTIPLGEFDRGESGQGGSISPFGDGLVVIEPKGAINFVSLSGVVQRLPQRVELRTQELVEWLNANDRALSLQWYRTLDSLIIEDGGGHALLVSYHRFNPEGRCVNFVVSRIGIVMEAGAPLLSDDGWRDVFVGNRCLPLPPDAEMFSGHEGGGRIIEFAPGRLLVSIGFFGFDGVLMSPALPQNPNVHIGKIVEVNLRTGRARIYAQGVRNPQGLMRDSRGRIWETEHGPYGGDELNIIRRGADYGFPATTYGMQYGRPRSPWPNNREQGRHARGYTLPIYFFSPSIGISNLIEAPAQEFPLWRGDLLVASMISETLYRVRLRGRQVISVEPMPMGKRIRDIVALPDGRVVLLMDFGSLVILQRQREGEEAPPPEMPERFIGYAALARSRAADPSLNQQLDQREFGRRLFDASCAQCHSLDGTASVGPTLQGVLDRRIGSLPDYAYSQAMREARGNWTLERLALFVTDPEGTIPGTTMPHTGVHYHEFGNLYAYLWERQRAEERE